MAGAPIKKAAPAAPAEDIENELFEEEVDYGEDVSEEEEEEEDIKGDKFIKQSENRKRKQQQQEDDDSEAKASTSRPRQKRKTRKWKNWLVIFADEIYYLFGSKGNNKVCDLVAAYNTPDHC